MPKETNDRAINVIHLEAKDKEKVKELEVMPIKKSTTKKSQVSEEVTEPIASMETEEEDTSKGMKQKKRTSKQRKITIKDFPLGSKEEPYDLVEDVSS